MPTFMTQFSYTAEAAAALAKNPEDRNAPVAALLENLEGRLISTYYSFGEYDGLIIFEAPDEKTALTSIAAASMAGHLKETKTTLLFTVEDSMEALGKAGGIVFQTPKS